MKNNIVYLDHNILHYYAVGFPRGIDAAAEQEALKKLVMSTTYRVGVSPWNLVEIALDTDVKRATAMVGVVDSVNAVWVSAELFVEQEEIRNYVYANYYGSVRAEVPRINAHVSQMCATITSDALTIRVGEDCGSVVDELRRNGAGVRILREVAATVPNTLTTIQRARANRTWNKGIQDAGTRSWFRSLLPARCPNGQHILPDTMDAIAARLTCHEKEVLKECPAVSAHSFAAEFRTKDVHRRPERQDALDLMHWTTAMGSCDVLVTAERYLQEASRQYSRKLKQASRTYCYVSELVARESI